MTHFVLCPFGTSGDVNPFIGLGIALRGRGHKVTVVANEQFRRSVEIGGLDFAPAGTRADYEEFVRHPLHWNPIRGVLPNLRMAAERIPDFYGQIARLADRSEIVLAACPSAFGARIAQEVLRVPLVTLCPSTILLPPISPTKSLEPGIRAVWSLAKVCIDRMLSTTVNRFRSKFGLTPVRRLWGAWCYSPQGIIGLWPKWFYPYSPSWPRPTILTGFIDYDGVPSAMAVEAHSGPPAAAPEKSADSRTIVFTVASGMTDRSRFFEAAVAACGILQCRGLLITAYPEQLPDSLPPNIEHVSFASFSALLPRMSAIVHHGGIGTSAQALKAGIPQLITPSAHDQFANAICLSHLGVARWLYRKRFDGRAIAATLSDVLDSESVAENCLKRAEQISAGDGLSTTCEHMETLARHPTDQLQVSESVEKVSP
jgi:UDP:flavonoid glycosyltransferase YjiC (YdhE family)